MRDLLRSLFVLLLILLNWDYGLAQSDVHEDTIPAIRPGIDSIELKQEIDTVYEEPENKPLKAAYYAAILPGLGQVYNKKYWKLPILIGGMGTVGYYISLWDKKHQQFRVALIEKKYFPDSNNPLTQLSEDNLQRGIDVYRRYRDLNMILMVGIYFIQIVDAHVDAHLMDFDISENLSLRLQPSYEPAQFLYTRHYGLKFSINFN